LFIERIFDRRHLDFVIETKRLIGGYGRSLVLREVSLRVPRGSIYGFLGPNGAGKTTAMRTVLGLLRPVSGEICLFGQPLSGALPGILSRVGSLIEQPSLYDHLTGKENLEIARRLKGLKRSDAERAIEALGVAEYVGKRVREYSRGMRQRLGLAIAVLGNPELLLLDEPMNGLDANGLRTLRSMLQRLHQEHGTTILLSSHQFEEVEQVATHIGIMSSVGDLLFQGPCEQLSGRVPQELVIKVDRREDLGGNIYYRRKGLRGIVAYDRRSELVERAVCRRRVTSRRGFRGIGPWPCPRSTSFCGFLVVVSMDRASPYSPHNESPRLAQYGITCSARMLWWFGFRCVGFLESGPTARR
jgi:lantibiotic transport system ATP-binding protein